MNYNKNNKKDKNFPFFLPNNGINFLEELIFFLEDYPG